MLFNRRIDFLEFLISMAAYIKPRFWAATTDYSTNIANVIAQKTEIAQLLDDVALLNST